MPVEELKEGLRDSRELSVVYDENAVCNEPCASVVPVDDGEREGVAAVDEHEVERGWLKSRQDVLRPANMKTQPVSGDPSAIEVRDAFVSLRLKRCDTRVARRQKGKQHHRKSNAGLQRAGARETTGRQELVALAIGEPNPPRGWRLTGAGEAMDLWRVGNQPLDGGESLRLVHP